MLNAKRLAAVLAIGLAAAPARAEVTADQATALQSGMRGWVAGLFTPLLDAAAVPVTLSAAGERYKAEFGIWSGIPGVTMTSSGATTAFLRPLGGTRWAIEDFKLPQEFGGALDLGSDNPGSGEYTMHIGEQSLRGEIDTSLATPSRWEGRWGGIVQTMTIGLNGAHTTRMERATFDATWTPVAGGLINAASTSSIDGYSVDGSAAASGLSYTVGNVRATMKADGVDFARIGAALRTASGLAAGIRADIATGGKSTAPTAEQRAALHTLLDAVFASVTRVDLTEQMSKVHFAAAGMTGDLAQAEFGGVFGAPGGNAEIRLRLATSGLELPSLPAGAIRSMVPRRVVLAPRISGVPKATLVTFLAHAIDVMGDPDVDLADEATDLLADNPVTIGVDELLVELAVARLTGSGQVQVSSPTDAKGAGELRMTGADEFIKLLGQSPDTRISVPAATLLKGMGKAEGKETVWRIAYADGKVTVNGTDLSALMGGGAH